MFLARYVGRPCHDGNSQLRRTSSTARVRALLARFLFYAAAAAAAGATGAHAAGTGQTLGYHEIQVDSQGMIVPWYSPDPGLAYDHDINLVWNWWKNLETCPNGVKYYLQHQVWKPTHDPRGLGGDQLAMALSSWRLLYAYSGDSTLVDDMVYMADYYLGHSLSGPSATWPNLPYPYNTTVHSGVYDGDMVAGVGFTQPDKAGSFAFELVNLYKITGVTRCLTAAVDIADTLARRITPGDAVSSPWPFRVDARTGVVRDSYTANYASTLSLFDELIRLNHGDVSGYASARSKLTAWLKAYPMTTNRWGPFFEDVRSWSDTEINADTFAMYILEHPEWDATWQADARAILDWSYRTFQNSAWSQYGATAINEQTAYLAPGNSHTSRHWSVELLYAEKTGDVSRRAQAIRGLNWATYMVDVDGKNQYPQDDIWLTDGYGDYVRHYLRAMAAAPELAPAGQNHLLRSTSVVTSVSYTATSANYTTYDTASREVLRVGFTPSAVTAGGVSLPRLSSISELDSQPGYTFEAPGDAPGVLRIRHDSGSEIAVVHATDTTPPAAVGDLATSGPTSSSITLTWTAPGNDGNTGTASQYDIRYRSDAPVTEANWSDATPVSGAPAPAAAGTVQNVVVTGLPASTTYYFALRTADAAPNWSALSNSPAGSTTAVPDTTPPAAVGDLATSGATSSSIVLTWTAPGNDGTTGMATQYDIRYRSDAPVTEANWSDATPVSGAPAPAAAGTVQDVVVTGLAASTTYYFALRTADAAPNWSALSNSPGGSTTAAPDTTPPAAVGDLATSGPTSSSIVLTWTAPGNDGTTGMATQYDIRYRSDAPVTEANWSDATPVSGAPAPAAAGTVQDVVVTGLAASTTYYFALRTADAAPNWSALSNSPAGSTTAVPDTTPPAAVGDLATSGPTSSSIVLTWTAPGNDGNMGAATQYDIRYRSDAPVTEANWSDATPVSGAPAPAAAGTVQSVVVTALTASTTYYFALRTADAAPNWSALSNSPAGSTTAVPDTTPPAAVGDLATSGPTSSSITLTWTAPGNDGNTGTASQYDIRYRSDAPVTEANWSDATPVSGAPAPAAAGTVQNVVVTGLPASTTYYFALRTADAAPNWSALSNSPGGSTTAAPDTTPPAAVGDLATSGATSSSIVLTWTAPGNDGTTGMATQYDIRYRSDAPITEANWSDATPVSGAPAPAAAGTVQNVVVTGLAASTTYYFALRTADAAPNWSALSNSPGGSTTAAPDTTPPAAVGDLATSGPTSSSIVLTWTAPGNDGTTGMATQYDIRYRSDAPVTEANWSDATPVSGAPAPAAAGTVQSVVVTGLAASTTYYFALRTADAAPNWSALSNSPAGSTTAVPDTTPPAAVGDLATSGATSSSIVLTWTAPGNDGTTGMATQYDIRYRSDAPVTEANWSDATPVSGAPAPAAAGTVQDVVVTGLAASTTYYFALRTADAAPNWSALSNSPGGSTTAVPDTTPPAAVGDLATSGPTSSSIVLTWTAPGNDGTTGMATQYDIRYRSDAPVTEANWSDATPVSGAPAPAAAGTVQNVVVTGLAASTTYYFALRTADAAPNWSALSNSPAGSTTAVPDTTPPAAVGDLATSGPTSSSITLTWTAPGNDGNTGTASQYDIRYRSDAPVTEANWSDATPVSGAPAPAAAGTVQSVVVTGLPASTTYYFALRTADAAPNWSALSNSPGGVTPAAAATVGYTRDGAVGDVAGANYVNAFRYQAVSDITATVMRIRLFAGGTGAMKLGIYGDDNGAPGAFLGGTEEKSGLGTGWQSFTLSTPLSLAQDAYYWLVVWTDDNAYFVWATPEASACTYAPATYGSVWPSAFPGGVVQSGYRYSVYAEGAGAGTTPAAAATIGYTRDGAVGDLAGADYVNAFRYQAVSDITATVMRIRLFAGGTGAMKLGIYGDDNGAPGAFLGGTEEKSGLGAGWQSFTLSTPLSLAQDAYYWLVVWTDDNAYFIWATPEASACTYAPATYGTVWPGAFPGGVVQSGYRYSVYAEGAGAGTAPPLAVRDPAPREPTSNSITLTWTGPGNGGNTGTASRNDSRSRSDAPGAAAGRSGATLVSGAAAAEAGTVQSAVVARLAASTTHHVGVRTAQSTADSPVTSDSPRAPTTLLDHIVVTPTSANVPTNGPRLLKAQGCGAAGNPASGLICVSTATRSQTISSTSGVPRH